MTLKLKAASGLKWQLITIAGRQFLSLAVFMTLTRLLDQSIFGLVGLVIVYLNFVAIFADQGISTALIQRKDLLPGHLDSAFWFNIGCAGMLCLGTISLANPVAVFLGDPRLVPLLRWASLALVINASATIHATLFIKALDFRRPAIRVLIANLVGGVVGVGMAFAGFGVWALIGQQLAASLGGSVFLWGVSDYRPSVRFSFVRLRELLYVSSSTLATSILWFLSSRVDQLVIGRFAGVRALGTYVVASKGPDLAQMVTHQPIADVSLPALSHLQDDHAKMRDAICSGMELNALVSFPVFVGLALIASDMIPALFGAKWVAAAAPCSLLCLYGLINALQVLFHPAILASGGIGKYVILNIWHTGGVIIACVVGIHYSVTGLILGLIANGLIIFIPNLLFLRHRIGLRVWRFIQSCAAPAMGAFAMAITIYTLNRFLLNPAPLVLRLVVNILAGAVAYILCVALLAPAAVRKLLAMIRHTIRGADGPKFISPDLEATTTK